MKDKNKWVTFTYKGKETGFIIILFKNTNANAASRTNNKIKQHLLPQ